MINTSRLAPYRIAARLRREWTRLRPATRTKVFGIGMPKTGTTTLGVCMNVLGYKHQSYNMDLASSYVGNRDVNRLVATAKRFESFEDWPWHLSYRDLDKAFPSSKFIITRRKNTESYVDSLRRHRHRHGQLDPVSEPEPYWWKTLFLDAYGTFNPELHKDTYEDHYQKIEEYFKKRQNDVLHVCWEAGDGWVEICQFLNRPIPTTGFPHANKGGI